MKLLFTTLLAVVALATPLSASAQFDPGGGGIPANPWTYCQYAWNSGYVYLPNWPRFYCMRGWPVFA